MIPKRQARAWERAGIKGSELAELENSARGTVVQLIGGVALILTFAATWAQIADTRRATDETLDLTAVQQENERFTTGGRVAPDTQAAMEVILANAGVQRYPY